MNRLPSTIGFLSPSCSLVLAVLVLGDLEAQTFTTLHTFGAVTVVTHVLG